MKVVPFPVAVKVNDIPAMARKFADEVDAGTYGNISSVIILIDGQSLDLAFWGEALNRVEGIGMLEVAKAKMVSDIMEDEE